MPIHRGKDKNGCYYQWGHRTKYYYTCNNKRSRENAKKKATKQMIAIYASGWQEPPEYTKMKQKSKQKKQK